MIIFRKISYRNFLMSGNAPIELQLDQHPLTLVVGNNGSGKSTLIDALCFALYGKPFRDINKPLLVNSINQKDCEVTVEFDIGDRSYRVVRGIKPNIFEIYVNDEMINQDAATKDYQEYLEEAILKINFKSFTQIVVLGASSFVPFMRLPAATRREIVEDLLDIKVFSQMNTILKSRISSSAEEIVLKDADLRLAKNNALMQDRHIRVMQEDRERRINELEAKLEETRNTIATTEETLKGTQAEIREIQESISDSFSVEEEVDGKTQEISLLKSEISDLKREQTFYEKGGECPTCKQEIESSFRNSEHKKCGAAIQKKEERLSLLVSNLSRLQERLEHIRKTENDLLKPLQERSNQVLSSLNSLELFLDKLETERKELVPKKGGDLAQEKKTLTEMSKEVVRLTKELAKLREDAVYLDIAASLLKDSGIKTKIVKQYVPLINQQINKYLRAMDFFVAFELDENFQESIKSRYRDKFSYGSFSEGQKHRIDLSLILTWREIAKLRNNASTNLLILDEIFDSSLDDEGLDYLMSLLILLGEESCVWVISPKGERLYDKFENIVRFVEKRNFSVMLNGDAARARKR